jgi:RecG-like helicase
MPLAAALSSAHEPATLAAADHARRRLAFDEFLELFEAE